MNVSGTTRLQTVDGTGLRFEARFASGVSTTLDSGPGAQAPNPVETLLGALATCEAMDVISILRKKRLAISAYEVVMSGERLESHPRRFVSVTLTHRVTGTGVPRAAVEEAVRLSATRYCSVRFTLDPTLPIEDVVEVIEG
jgi:putative redox protein